MHLLLPIPFFTLAYLFRVSACLEDKISAPKALIL
jgi:hypothetical protein